MRFVAVDIETSNANLCSICQIGSAIFVEQQPPRVWQSYVNPEDYFDPVNVSVHGISAEKVKQAPTFPKIHSQLLDLLKDQIIVSHTHFDRVALQKVCDKYGLPHFSCSWLDSARVARRAWPNLADGGYGLLNICRNLGIELKHHAAGEDARAAGEIMLHAIASTGVQLSEWLKRVNQPIYGVTSSKVTQDGNPEGPLAGEVIVFTGALSIPRRKAASMAAVAGCDVDSSVTKKTTLLVVGNQDIRRLGDHDKSSKHRKAEALIQQGQLIRILGESDFFSLIGQP